MCPRRDARRGNFAEYVPDLHPEGHFYSLDTIHHQHPQRAVEVDQLGGMSEGGAGHVFAEHTHPGSSVVALVSFGTPKRIQIAGQPVVTHSSEQLRRFGTVADLDAAANELVGLGVHRQPGLGVLDHHANGTKKISPSREASGLIVMTLG